MVLAHPGFLLVGFPGFLLVAGADFVTVEASLRPGVWWEAEPTSRPVEMFQAMEHRRTELWTIQRYLMMRQLNRRHGLTQITKAEVCAGDSAMNEISSSGCL